jgi:uncharacterized protein (DUF433 family)
MRHEPIVDLGQFIRFAANTGTPNVPAYALDLPPERKVIPTDGKFTATVTAAGAIYGNFVSIPAKLPMVESDSSRATLDLLFSTATTIDPDPRINGTMIPIYRVSALSDGGSTIEQIAQDFPSLTKAQIVESINYAQANPPPFGNSYPKESLKRLLRNSGFADLKRSLRKGKKRS